MTDYRMRFYPTVLESFCRLGSYRFRCRYVTFDKGISSLADEETQKNLLVLE